MFGLIVLAGFGVLALWSLAYLVWVGRRERLEELNAGLKQRFVGPLPSVLQGEQLVESHRQRYLRGEIDLDEFEAGVDRAFHGGHADRDREWLDLSHERRLDEALARDQAVYDKWLRQHRGLADD